MSWKHKFNQQMLKCCSELDESTLVHLTKPYAERERLESGLVERLMEQRIKMRKQRSHPTDWFNPIK
jgi:hypothetical protein